MERFVRIDFGGTLIFCGQFSIGFALAEYLISNGLNKVQISQSSGMDRSFLFFEGICILERLSDTTDIDSVVNDFLAAIVVRKELLWSGLL